MSLPVSHGPAFFSPDGARDAGEVVAARRVERERLIDDELAQSFPRQRSAELGAGCGAAAAASGCR